jgi:predicted DNA-binding transcriptional regulator AlpA
VREGNTAHLIYIREILGVDLRDPVLLIVQENQPNPRSVADVIEGFGRMLTTKELAPLIGHEIKSLYAKGNSGKIPGQAKLAGTVAWDCYVVAAWLRRKAA